MYTIIGAGLHTTYNAIAITELMSFIGLVCTNAHKRPSVVSFIIMIKQYEQ